MKVGIPRALLYYRYGRFWERFISELGHEVVVSRKTDKVLVQEGVKRVPSEVCLPIKIVAGHVMELAGRVDALFLPRVMSMDDRLYACPKMIGIVDICRMMLGPGKRLIAPGVRGGLFWPHFRAGLELNPNPLAVVRAWHRARALLPSGPGRAGFPDGEKRIGLIGHFYNTGDEYVSRPVVETFERHGYRVVTKEDLAPAVLRAKHGRAGTIRWVYERELYNAFRFLLDKVDGICVIVSMGCGPDSLVAEFMRQDADGRGAPFLQLVVDEHTGFAGLVTRIEAFIELAQRRPGRFAA
ncbi:hypothetical protein FJY71_04960 [candidate division WOR-3 bacterium]|nr:hypothetical protein [candidate division WOR-3 bacterium]